MLDFLYCHGALACWGCGRTNLKFCGEAFLGLQVTSPARWKLDCGAVKLKYVKRLILNVQHSCYGTAKGIKKAPQLPLTPHSDQGVNSGT